MLKRFITLLFCLFLILSSIPIWGYTSFLCAPVYADSVPQGYSPAGYNDQVDAFLSYCKSRNLAIEGSSLDALTSFTSSKYQDLCNTVGLDINQLQNEIYKNTSGTGSKWFFTAIGISGFNRLFAELLQNNDIEVGEVVDKNVYSGKKFVDLDGNSCLCYIVDSSSFTGTNSHILAYGTPYIYSGKSLETLYSSEPNKYITFRCSSRTSVHKYLTQGTTSGSVYTWLSNSGGLSGMKMYGLNKTSNILNNSSVVVMYNESNNKYYWGSIGLWDAYPSGYSSQGSVEIIFENNEDKPSAAIISFTTNNTTINNNNYEGDTYITNEGDVINNPPSGGTDPGWNVGGGQGSYNDGQGNNYTINFPDFELPDLNIDWSIQGLGNKFPFSIPFDIVSLVTVLNAEPEAPRFQGTVNFGFTTWDYDINLQQFDTVASVCRIAELLLLVFGLILITRSIIKG